MGNIVKAVIYSVVDSGVSEIVCWHRKLLPDRGRRSRLNREYAILLPEFAHLI